MTGLPFRVVHSNMGTQVRLYIVKHTVEIFSLVGCTRQRLIDCVMHTGEIVYAE